MSRIGAWIDEDKQLEKEEQSWISNAVRSSWLTELREVLAIELQTRQLDDTFTSRRTCNCRVRWFRDYRSHSDWRVPEASSLAEIPNSAQMLRLALHACLRWVSAKPQWGRETCHKNQRTSYLWLCCYRLGMVCPGFLWGRFATSSHKVFEHERETDQDRWKHIFCGVTAGSGLVVSHRHDRAAYRSPLWSRI